MEELIKLAEVEAKILSNVSVDNCVVLTRQTENLKQELVAYVVPSGPLVPEQLLSHLKTTLPVDWMPTAVVPVSTLPLTATGQIDKSALSALEVSDSDLVQRWEEQIQSLPKIEQVAVVLQKQIENQSLLHLSSLLPENQFIVSEGYNTLVSNQTRQSELKQVLSLNKPAISHGGLLKLKAGAPTLLPEILQRATYYNPEKSLVYIQPDGSEQFQSYKALLEDAQRILTGLRKLGLKSGDKIIFQMDYGQDFIPAFWGCVLGGFVPVPISIAPTYEQVNNTVNKLYSAWQMLEQPIVLTSAGLAESVHSLSTLLTIENFQVETVDNLRSNEPDCNIHQGSPQDLTLILLTSGSTGLPKGVMLSHCNLLSMSAGMVQMNGFSSQEVTLNWMPLDHVGAIALLGIMAVDLGCQQIHIPTQLILQNPLKWLDLIEHYKATISWAPNFAFSLIGELANEINQRSWDISSMRFLVNGGEQIVAKTARKFLKLLRQHGLPANAMRPGFGMSETSSGITSSDGFLLENTSDDPTFVELGSPIPGASIRIVDENNQVVTEGIIGRFQVKGLSTTLGYYQNPKRNREAFTKDGWFNTGDLGYIKSGQIVLTGRDKDDVIINGINYYSYEIESVVEEVEGVEVSYTAACSVRIPGSQTDKLAIFFSSPFFDLTSLKALTKKIRGAVVKNIGVNPDYLISVEKDAIPKTAIGKIQRAQLKKRFEAGEFDAILNQYGIYTENPNLLPNWFYHKIWRQKLPVTLAPLLPSGQFLVFLDRLGLGEYLCAELEKLNQPYVCVEAGIDFAKLSRNHYRITPNNPDHYKHLLDALRVDSFDISKILHLWTYDEYVEEVDSLEALETSQEKGVYSILLLVQALSEFQGFSHQFDLSVISSHTQFTCATDEIAYEKAPILSLLKTISQEIPEAITHHIDLSLAPAKINSAYILQELRASSKDIEVSYRQGQRWVPYLKRVDWCFQQKQELPLKPGGMYLISGGLGGIGKEIAQYLLKHYQARLLLVGRTPLPERSTWSTHLKSSNAISEKIQVVQALEQLEGEVIYQAVDICDLVKLQQVVEQARFCWQCQLDGIIHLAGIYQERAIIEETQESWSATLRPKVFGTWVLHQLIKDQPNAVFINFSSVNSFFGGAAVGAFAAANSFVESFSHYQRHKAHLHSYCYSWSLWDNLGMSRNFQRADLVRAKGYYTMNAQQGLSSLLVGLRYAQTQLFIGLDGSNQHIRRYIEAEFYKLQKLTSYLTTSSNDVPIAQLQKLVVCDRFGTPSTCDFVRLPKMPLTEKGEIDREKLSGNYQDESDASAAPETDTERQVAQIWQEVLGLKEVGIHDNFFELGGHSLLLVQVQSKLQEYFDLQLSVVEMFRYPTIDALAKYLAQEPTGDTAVQQGQERAKRRSRRKTAASSLDVAVIGISCRFPGADTVEAFWQNLCGGVESISFFTDEEVLASGIDPELVQNPNYVKGSPILSNITSFDAQFFSYSAKEAELMDPQHRLLLECAWEGLENAGYNPLNYKGSIGIYAGAAMNTYLLNNIYPNRHHLDANDDMQVATLDSMGGFQMMVANDKDYLTTRISYKLNFTGPSVNVQTACSTSLAAIHMASQSLLNGECDMALAGGVSVQVPQKIGHLYQEGMILSPDGHCRAFDTRAQGTIFGSGVGIVVLKQLENAITDGDHIYAVIKGSALNNDGGTKVGYLAPNGDGQAAVASEAMLMAGVEAETITYVETHGTGTNLGDPIEIAGLTQAFHGTTNKKNFCAIGSVKTNVGHLQIASGAVGFIKTVLSLHHKKLPACLHFEQPNPQIDFANSPFYVNTTLRDWNITSHPRRAGVNSLGIGGVNVHAILEEALEITPVDNDIERPIHLLNLSAKTEKALQELVDRYQNFLSFHPEISLSNICFTANTGRAHFDYRLAIVASSTVQLQEQLNAFCTRKEGSEFVSGQVISGQPLEIAFLFTGQGSQYINMGRQLYETQPIFRKNLEHCDEILRPYLEKPLLSVLYPDSESNSPLDETGYTQPALFALEYALFQLWNSWGIKPTVVMGHSVGEYVAACVAGVFSLEDGLKLIAERGRLMQAIPQDGKMVSVAADEAQVAAAIQPYVQAISIAAINGSNSIVLSGQRQVVEVVITSLEAEGIKTKELTVSHAFHSPLMEPVLAAFQQVAKEVTYSLPQIKIISNVTGRIITDEIMTPEYWCRHMRQSVRFGTGMETLYQQGYEMFVEIGPKPILLGMGRHCLPEGVGTWLPSLRPEQSDWKTLLLSLGTLYIHGVSVDWFGFEQDYQRQRVALPTYPFQRQRYWIEATRKHSHMANLSNDSQDSILSLLIEGDIKQLIQKLEIVEQLSEEETKSLLATFN